MKKAIPLVIGLGLLAAGVVAGAQFGSTALPFLSPGQPGQQADHPPAASKPNGPAQKEQGPAGIAFPTRERIVNLADTGLMRYLKTTIVLEVAVQGLQGELPKGDEYKKKQDELAKDLRGQTAAIDDQITNILSAKTSGELVSNDGKQRLKDELKSRLNTVLGEDRVLAVYFTDFIIQ
ncbi:MAG: flagellar basal body-associated FliL family protein [Chloroflexi bacterium]|nr:flagellar basal body-associated FliL family protein [Chloroflexota bacterium]